MTVDGTNAAITPHGDIDFDTLPGLLNAARALPATVTAVTWDMYDVPFMDVAGLHLLSSRRPHRTARFVGLRPQPQRVVTLATHLFPAAKWGQSSLG
ncbi:STAS domain-containing protein [Streptantibioticus parmotrematis]|nr:STAS domain-containing protein [Streptantibioticus parmotrematis]